MTIDRRDIGRIIKELKSAGTDTQNVEVKESTRKLPASIVETLSAFSNATGGTLILGLSEANGFVPVPDFRAKSMADALATICSDKMMPPVRPEILLVEYAGSQLVVAYIPECIPRDKPCYVTERGVYHGSFTRVSDGDRKLTSYEVDRLLENRQQPAFDIEPIDQASAKDLDQELTCAVLARQRELHPRIFSSISDDEALANLHVLTRGDNGKTVPTLAGLLALGVYPQKYFPRLTVAFTAYESEPGRNPAMKCVDAQTMAGPIPIVLEDTLAAIQRNTQAGEAPDASATQREDASGFPLDVAREAIANALMHRDYSPASRGTAVQVSLYPDYLEITSPGGLYGTLTVENLGKPCYSSTRNQFLASLLESVPYQDGYMVENRGTGYHLIQQELEHVGMQQPEVHNSISMFSLIIRKKLPESPAANPDAPGSLLDILASVSDASASELATMTGLARSTVLYRLRKLEAQGAVERIGETRSPKQRYRLAASAKVTS